MTVQARDGRDGPFSDWLRKNPSIDSVQHGMYATDIDMTFFKYRMSVDAEGTREVKLMMDVEIKTFDSLPNPAQTEALFFRHQLLRNLGTRAGSNRHQLISTFLKRRVAMWNFGQFILRMSSDRPDKSLWIEWIRFNKQGLLAITDVDEDELARILRFDVRPDTLQPLSLRRHHLTREVCMVDETGLFPVERRIFKRS